MPIGCGYKTGSNMQSKDEIEHAVFESFREFLLVVRFFRLRLGYCSANFSTGSPSFTPVSTAHTNKHTINKKNKGFIVELESEEIKIWR